MQHDKVKEQKRLKEKAKFIEDNFFLVIFFCVCVRFARYTHTELNGLPISD